MRERLARWLAVATGVLLLMLAAALAGWLNRNAPPPAAISPALTEMRAHGEQVYAQQRCARCHSIAGKGNTRLPLDGVTGRHDEQALRHWITGDIAIGAPLSARVRSAKAGYAQIPEPDMAALIAYLQGLPEPPSPR